MGGTSLSDLTEPPAPVRPPTAPALLDRLGTRFGADEALVTGGRRWSYRELAAAARETAAGLRALGVDADTSVGLLCTNRPEWLHTLFGAGWCGATVSCFHTWVGTWDLDHLLATAEVEVLVTMDRFRSNRFVASLTGLVPELGEAGPGGWRSARYPKLRTVVVIGDERPPGALSWADLRARGAAERPVGPPAASPDRAAVVLYTSGSTARPKGVPLVHRDLVENGYQIGERMGLGPRDRVWVSAPLFWSYGSANALMASLTHRSTILLQETFEPGPALEILTSQRATAGYFLPHLTRALIDEPGFDPGRLTTLRTGLTIGLPDDLRLVAERLGVAGICNIYGSTETYGNCCVTPWTAPLARRMHSQGPPLPGMTVRIVDPDGAPVPPGEEGQILVGGRITPGYLGQPELNAHSFTADGLLRTGDVGHLDEDGWLVFGARESEMIKTGGINVAPAEVEEFLSRHPDVRQVAVTGAPDPVHGQQVVAFVVAGPGLDEPQLRAYCQGRIASFKVPARIVFLDALPTTVTGKLNRRALADLARPDNEDGT
ncbi:MAG: AMP-binding protein [Micromonosporaceae bacterium]|nr:AMP-binding protein [Micromonosporaceae bacterium]